MKTRDYVIIAVFVIVIVILLLFRKEIVNALTKATAKVADPAKADTTTPVVLDRNRTLAKGVYDSEEVKELQRLLGGITVDGDFGQETEDRLEFRKGTSQTTLNMYAGLADVSNGASGEWSEDEEEGDWSITEPGGLVSSAGDWIMDWVS